MNARNLAALFDQLRQSILAELRVSMPGRVVAYHEATQRVDVQPLLKETRVGPDGKLLVESLPVITNCPIASSYRIRFPIVVGDVVWLIFADRSIDQWLAKGATAEVDPVDLRRHHLSDAIAIPGLFHDVEGRPSVHFTDTQIRLGDDAASQALALASKVRAELQALRDAIATTWVPVAGDGGASLKLLFAPPTGALQNWPADVGSATVKAKD